MSVSVLAPALHGHSRISRSVVPNESVGEESGVITHRIASNQSCFHQSKNVLWCLISYNVTFVII